MGKDTPYAQHSTNAHTPMEMIMIHAAPKIELKPYSLYATIKLKGPYVTPYHIYTTWFIVTLYFLIQSPKCIRCSRDSSIV